MDADIRQLLDAVKHERLVEMTTEEINGWTVPQLIHSVSRSGVLEEGNLIMNEYRTPQGSVISPLLVNVYPHPFEVEMTHRKHKLVRYAEDCLIPRKTTEQAMIALGDARETLGKLGLSLKDEKTRIANISEGIQFLFEMYENDKVPRKESVRKFRNSIS